MVDLDRIIASAQDLVEFFRGVEPDAQVAALFFLVCAYMLAAGLITKLAEPKFEYTVANTMPRLAADQAVEVLLNGQPVERCIYANTLTGKVICHKPDAAGHCYIEPGTDEVATEERWGIVQVNIINNTTRGSI